ncbi:MAG TPA: hypothetical protein VL049_04070 [Candidatus Dormibacteraeota bacterium]|nr:hypothetical protein [Candidatus Dormibacteraeota bacterium]
MKLLRDRFVWVLLGVSFAVCCPSSPVYAHGEHHPSFGDVHGGSGGDDDEGSAGDDDDSTAAGPCSVLIGQRGFGLCIAFCEALNCDEHPRHPCEILRRNFERQTGNSTFPCEGTVSPSETPTFTPTGTPAGTATATVTSPPTDTATSTATATVAATDTPTDTPTGIPTGTAAATATDTATAPPDTATPTDTTSPTDTPTGIPTGTAAATATDTATPPPPDTPTPTDTELPTDTPTGIPTGTAEATATDTAVAVETSTPTDTALPTDTPTGIPTGTAATTATATTVPATTTPTGVPTGTSAAETPIVAPAAQSACGDFGGVGFGLCAAYCGLDCGLSHNRPCQMLLQLFERVTGETSLSCQRQAVSCSSLGGRLGRLCERFCDRCDAEHPSRSCQRLERHLQRAADAPMQCD